MLRVVLALAAAAGCRLMRLRLLMRLRARLLTGMRGGSTTVT